MIISPRTWIASHDKIDIDSTVYTIEGYSIFYISILQTISLTGLQKSCIAIIRDSKLGTLGWIFNAVFIAVEAYVSGSSLLASLGKWYLVMYMLSGDLLISDACFNAGGTWYFWVCSYINYG